MVFLFGLSIGLSLNNNSNENSITLGNSLRSGRKSDSNQNPAFVQTPPGQRYSGQQSTNSQNLSEMPPRFWYRTALLGGKKLPDNPGGGGSWDGNNQDTDDEFAWKNFQKDPEVWSKYQEYCQYQSKKGQSCDLIEIKSKIKENPALVGFAEGASKDPRIQRDLNGLIEQLRVGNESPGTGIKPLFIDIKKKRRD